MSRTLPNTRRLALILAIGILGVASGCQTISNSHRATPVEPGTVELAGAMGHSTPRSRPDPMGAYGVRLLQPEMSGRVGIDERLDLGLRVGIWSAGTDVNVALVDTPNFTLSVNPEVLAQSYTEEEFNLCIMGGCGSPEPDRHFMVRGGGRLLADVIKSEYVSVTTGVKGMFSESRTTLNYEEVTSSSPQVGALVGVEVAKDKGGFARVFYDNRYHLEADRNWGDRHYHTMTVAGGYRF